MREWKKEREREKQSEWERVRERKGQREIEKANEAERYREESIVTSLQLTKIRYNDVSYQNTLNCTNNKQIQQTFCLVLCDCLYLASSFVHPLPVPAGPAGAAPSFSA